MYACLEALSTISTYTYTLHPCKQVTRTTIISKRCLDKLFIKTEKVIY
jgi:hypothetical protein